MLLLPFLDTRKEVALFANDPIISLKSIWLFRYLIHKNLSTHDQECLKMKPNLILAHYGIGPKIYSYGHVAATPVTTVFGSM